jgi:LPXTG-site transpeptidase (sortase) family protein
MSLLRSKKAQSFKRYILPPVFGLLFTGAVLFALNGQWLTAQLKYRFEPPAMATVSADVKPSGDGITHIDPHAAPQISIQKIGVKAPVIFDEPSYTEWKIQLALRRGPVHYGTTAMPGQVGNVVIIGHSSGQLWAPGDYKFVFTLLDKLQAGDTINIGYNGILYTYKVTDTAVIKPTDFSILTQTSFPELTLVTCTPVGTSTNRLVVHAKQISPSPSTATPADPAAASDTNAKDLPQ